MATHENEYIDNRREFVHNNIVFTLSEDVSNHHNSIPILNDFNISTYSSTNPQDSDSSPKADKISFKPQKFCCLETKRSVSKQTFYLQNDI